MTFRSAVGASLELQSSHVSTQNEKNHKSLSVKIVYVSECQISYFDIIPCTRQSFILTAIDYFPRNAEQLSIKRRMSSISYLDEAHPVECDGN